MHIFLAALAVLFFVLSLVGFGFGGLPTLLFWALTVLCVFGAWKLRPNRQRRREDRATPPPP